MTAVDHADKLNTSSKRVQKTEKNEHVDHAELKRVAERCTHGDPWYKEGDLCGRQAFEQLIPQDRAFIAAANPAAVLALLSEIEGLKAERDSNWDEFLAERKSRMEHGAREAGYLDTISRLEARADEAERQLASLRTQAPDSWRPDREAVARIVDPAAFLFTQDELMKGDPSQFNALSKADRILALRPQTAESGK